MYDPEIALAVCDRIAEGEYLPAICASIPRGQSTLKASTFLLWVGEHPELAEVYDRARATRLQRMADEMMQIADTPQEGQTVEETADGVKIKRGDMIQHRSLQVDTRKWLLARLARQLYGDKSEVALTGKDGGPIVFKLETVGGDADNKTSA